MMIMPRAPDPSAPDAQPDLPAAMLAWNGKSAGNITRIYDRYRATPAFEATLVNACETPETECAATWLIKHHCDEGQAQFSEPLRARIYASLPTFVAWEAQLHVLQCTDHLPIPERCAPAVFDFVTAGVASPKTLVRAWSLYAAAQLAAQHPQHRPTVQALLEAAAQETPKGAVAVRLRKAQALLK